MAEFHDVVLLKSRADSDNDDVSPFWQVLEKVSILISLFVVLGLGLAFELPVWGIALLVGLSLGPIVYAHLYFIYIRPLKKKQNTQNEALNTKD